MKIFTLLVLAVLLIGGAQKAKAQSSESNSLMGTSFISALSSDHGEYAHKLEYVKAVKEEAAAYLQAGQNAKMSQLLQGAILEVREKMQGAEKLSDADVAAILMK